MDKAFGPTENAGVGPDSQPSGGGIVVPRRCSRAWRTADDRALKRGTVPLQDPTGIEGYHAHVYYDPATRAVAERIRVAIGAGFSVRLGRWHDRPVGPHPQSMYQVAFPVGEFSRLVPWLMLNREGLTILVHPLTGNDYDDHSLYPLWLGTSLPLRLEALRDAIP